jgi:hypothetical protein
MASAIPFSAGATTLTQSVSNTAEILWLGARDDFRNWLGVRSQGDDGIDARGAARWKIRRQQRYGRQGP